MALHFIRVRIIFLRAIFLRVVVVIRVNMLVLTGHHSPVDTSRVLVVICRLAVLHGECDVISIRNSAILLGSVHHLRLGRPFRCHSSLLWGTKLAFLHLMGQYFRARSGTKGVFGPSSLSRG